MSDVCITAFSPATPEEAAALVALGRSDRTLAGLVHAATRAQYLRAAGAAPCADGVLGLAAAEASACMDLALHPALDRGALRTKEVVLRPLCGGGGRLAAMLRAGLEEDRRRLGRPAAAGPAWGMLAAGPSPKPGGSPVTKPARRDAGSEWGRLASP